MEKYLRLLHRFVCNDFAKNGVFWLLQWTCHILYNILYYKRIKRKNCKGNFLRPVPQPKSVAVFGVR